MEAAEQAVDRLCRCLPAILADEPVRFAYLHASTVSGRQTPFSDVGVALVADGGMGPAEGLELMLRVQLALADQSGIDNADVRVINDAPSVPRGKIVTEGKLVYARDAADHTDYVVHTRLLYFDYLPAHRSLQRAFFQRVRQRGSMVDRDKVQALNEPLCQYASLALHRPSRPGDLPGRPDSHRQHPLLPAGIPASLDEAGVLPDDHAENAGAGGPPEPPRPHLPGGRRPHGLSWHPRRPGRLRSVRALYLRATPNLGPRSRAVERGLDPA